MAALGTSSSAEAVMALSTPETVGLHKMPLPWDVITEVMATLERPYAARMSRTCRTLRKAAPPILLKDTVIMYDQHAESFCAFMFADPRRFGMLHRLSLEMYADATTEGFRLAALLTQLLSRSTELEWLFLRDAYMLEVHDSIHGAISSMTKLRALHLDNAAEETAPVLETLSLPLSEINIDCLGHEVYEDPIPLLVPFRDTLKMVTVSCVELYSASDSDSPMPAPFPHVTTLNLQHCNDAELQAIEEYFPNLRHLSFELVLEEDYSEAAESERTLSLARERRPWALLDYLRGTVSGLYGLAIQCRVNHLDVASSYPIQSKEDCTRFGTMLGDFLPEALQLSIYLPAAGLTDLLESLSAAKETLRYVRLVLEWRTPEHTDPSLELYSFFESLAPFALKYLQIKHEWTPYPPKDKTFGEWLAATRAKSRQTRTAVDTLALARCAARCVPTLQHFSVEPDGPSWYAPEVFQCGEDSAELRGAVKLPWDTRAQTVYRGPPFQMKSY